MRFQKDVPVEIKYCGAEETLELSKGKYRFQLWGAQGGTENLTSARGGFVAGIISFTQKTKIFIRVGGQGEISSNQPKGGFNGGGDGFIGTHNAKAGGGGGATDIRLISTNLSSRILVAGGGGGDGCYSITYSGGSGGGLEGTDGERWTVNSAQVNGKKGTQVSGGQGVKYAVSSQNGTSGYGSAGVGIEWSGGGGGAGYFGGSGAYETGGGGGSGYISPMVQAEISLRGDQLTGKLIHIGNGLVIITLLSGSRITNLTLQRLCSVLLIPIFVLEKE